MLADCCPKGVYTNDHPREFGILTQRGGVMVRYTGTINANRH